MLLSVKTPPFGRHSQHSLSQTWEPQSSSTRERTGDQGRNLFNQLYYGHSLTSLHSPATWLLSEQWRGLRCSDSTSYKTLQQTTMAVNTSNVHIIEASIQGIIFLVKFLPRTRDGARHGGQPAQSPASQGVISQGWKKHKDALHQQSTLVQGLSDP